MRLCIELLGEAVAQGRPRMTTINGHPRAYDPAKSRTYKATLALLASQAMRERKLDLCTDAVALTVIQLKAIPKSMTKKKRQDAMFGTLRPTTKPDLDNVIKAVMDAFKMVVWRDDSQVVDIRASKFYADAPLIRIIIETVQCTEVGTI